MKRIILILLLAILMISPFAYSAGSSTGGGGSSGGSSDNSNNADTRTNTSSNNSQTNQSNVSSGSLINCEDKATLRERIMCRLQNRGLLASNETIPEACRDHNKTEECKRLYIIGAQCYKLENLRARKACFLIKAGVLQGGTLRSANQETKRDYVILLLYELQERVEKLNEEDVLTNDEATDIISLIVEIKKDIYEGKKRPEIIPKIRELKNKYFEAIR